MANEAWAPARSPPSGEARNLADRKLVSTPSPIMKISTPTKPQHSGLGMPIRSIQPPSYPSWAAESSLLSLMHVS